MRVSHRVIPGIAVGLALTVTLGAVEASAHEIGLVLRVLDSEVEIEGYFEGDEPARGAGVIVASKNGQDVATGQLDDDGRWRFPRPTAGSYRVTIDAGPGHVAQRSFVVDSRPAEPASTAGTKEAVTDSRASPPARDWKLGTWILAGFPIVLVLLVLVLRSRSPRDRDEPRSAP